MSYRVIFQGGNGEPIQLKQPSLNEYEVVVKKATFNLIIKNGSVFIDKHHPDIGNTKWSIEERCFHNRWGKFSELEMLSFLSAVV